MLHRSIAPSLHPALAGAAAVINAAGPFTSTAAPVMEAALRMRTPYIDVVAEPETTDGVGLSGADSRAAITQFLARNPGTSYVALDDAELVATILVGHDLRRGLIHHLAVATSHRRHNLVLRAASPRRSQEIQQDSADPVR